MALNVKPKLGKNTMKADSQKHIKINAAVCAACVEKRCLYFCPAHVYTLDTEGKLVLELDGCLECGTCKIACTKIEWNYPRAGFGIQYRYG